MHIQDGEAEGMCRHCQQGPCVIGAIYGGEGTAGLSLLAISLKKQTCGSGCLEWGEGASFHCLEKRSKWEGHGGPLPKGQQELLQRQTRATSPGK